MRFPRTWALGALAGAALAPGAGFAAELGGVACTTPPPSHCAPTGCAAAGQESR